MVWRGRDIENGGEREERVGEGRERWNRRKWGEGGRGNGGWRGIEREGAGYEKWKDEVEELEDKHFLVVK